ncbi:4Fe-4S dicluster domain-containing protein [Lachnospiraceae bacterium KGMB03038]|nr:4Fe-4S dicluster domain-containing protein [Lachnospiraceae bacterium KGMB03038]
MNRSPRIAQIGKECVACGTCLRVCPKEAIQIKWGITAHVDTKKCVGCGKCANICPAAIIGIVERSAAQ